MWIQVAAKRNDSGNASMFLNTPVDPVTAEHILCMQRLDRGTCNVRTFCWRHKHFKFFNSNVTAHSGWHATQDMHLWQFPQVKISCTWMPAWRVRWQVPVLATHKSHFFSWQDGRKLMGKPPLELHYSSLGPLSRNGIVASGKGIGKSVRRLWRDTCDRCCLEWQQRTDLSGDTPLIAAAKQARGHNVRLLLTAWPSRTTCQSIINLPCGLRLWMMISYFCSSCLGCQSWSWCSEAACHSHW